MVVVVAAAAAVVAVAALFLDAHVHVVFLRPTPAAANIVVRKVLALSGVVAIAAVLCRVGDVGGCGGPALAVMVLLVVIGVRFPWSSSYPSLLLLLLLLLVVVVVVVVLL